MTLSPEQIADLLKPKQKASDTPTIYPRPVQIGPLFYSTADDKCIRCSVDTRIRINDIPYCTTHALHKMADMFTKEIYKTSLVPFEDCDCEEGKLSMGQCHNRNCVVVIAWKENVA